MASLDRDRDAFAQLMRQHNQRMFRIARAILTDDAEAEDAVQEAWLSAYRDMDQFEGRSSLGSWLARIVAREALARAQRRKLTLVDDLEETAMNEQARDPERQAIDAEARTLLERAIDALPEGFRAVFVMRAVEEMSIAETSECLGILEDTVKTRLHRARGLLRTRLSRDLEAPAPCVFAFAGERCDRIVANVLRRLDE